MESIRLKYIAKIDMGQSPSSSDYTTENDEDGIPFLQGTAEFGEKYPTPVVYTTQANKIADEGDILFSVRAPVGQININKDKVGIGRGLCAIKANNKTSQDYLWWVLHASRGQLKLLETGTTYAAVSVEDISNMIVPLHEKSKQNKIVAYLDQEVAKIDALIEKKKRLVELLEEKKKATISQAVTKGLNPNVKLKSSGIDWLGDIPEHWEVVKLKYLTDGLKYGANEAAEEDNPDFPRYIRITDIDENGNLKPETFKSIPLEIANDYILEDGDILFARSGATVGKTFRYTSNYGKSAYAGYLIRMRPNLKIDSKYMYYFTLSNSYWSQIYIDSIQATIQNFSGDKYANMLVTIPSIDEQLKIAEFLDNHLIQFTFLRDKINNSIDLLTEKRTAIISAAINGEINL